MTKHIPPFIRSAYNYDTDAASLESGLNCPDPSLAQQQFKDDNNPNLIMEKYARMGDIALIEAQSRGTPQFGDFTSATDYQTSLNRVIAADTLFAGLSADVRARFHNSPAEFLAFFEKKENLSEAIKLGLMKEGTTLPEPLAPVVSKTAKGAKGSAPQEPAADD